jgi:hypothetical protein
MKRTIDRDLVKLADRVIHDVSNALTLYKTGTAVAIRFDDESAAATAMIGENQLRDLLRMVKLEP